MIRQPNKNKKIPVNPNGFSILEILIGITIFSIGILAIGMLHISSIKGNETSQGISEAASVALDQLETLMITPYATIASQTTPVAVHLKEKDYNVTWTVTENATDQTKTITLTIRWNDRETPRSIAVQHMIANIDN